MKLLITLFFISLSAFAATKKDNNSPTQIVVKFGDRESTFDFSSKNKMVFTNNLGRNIAIKLDDKDQKYFMNSIDSLQKQRTHELRFCINKYVTITKNNKSTLSCLDSGTKLATDTRELVNTLSSML